MGTKIDDCANDGGEEFFTEIHCVLCIFLLESLKICNSNATHLGEKFLATIFSAILYFTFDSVQ